MTVAAGGYLASPAFSRLWPATREAWERNGGISGNAVLNDLTESEAIEISGLLGRRRPFRAGATVRVPLVELDKALSEFATPLEEWLEATGGKLVDRRQERADAAAARSDLWADVDRRARAISPLLSPAVADLRRTGLARRLARQDERQLLMQALAVLERMLSLDRPLDIAALAAHWCGDAKALNAGSPIGTVVLRALAVIDGVQSPTDEEGRRELWERHLVVCDSLSSTVLTLNLRIGDDDTLARSLSISAVAREPRVITLRELARHTGAVANARIFICENPTVVNAAAGESIARECALICVEGWPSVAAHRLLRLARQGSVELLYHGDFDWHGLRIADSIVAAYDARPWRMTAGDYLDAVHHGAHARPLVGQPHQPSWDEGLARAMIDEAKVIEEEGVVLASLLGDLDAGEPGTAGREARRRTY
jgi:uncharacterized protein (TIGR02679 family)